VVELELDLAAGRAAGTNADAIRIRAVAKLQTFMSKQAGTNKKGQKPAATLRRQSSEKSGACRCGGGSYLSVAQKAPVRRRNAQKQGRGLPPITKKVEYSKGRDLCWYDSLRTDLDSDGIPKELAGRRAQTKHLLASSNRHDTRSQRLGCSDCVCSYICERNDE
jgi:hypothetical protein